MRRNRLALAFAFACALAGLAPPQAASGSDFTGSRAITLHNRDGKALPIGRVDFRPAGERTGFVLELDHARFKDFFLSMREFKCLEGEAEVFCHVPYPHPNPRTVTSADPAWLEHALLFFFKAPRDFGAKLWNGVYFRLEATPNGWVGTPQAIDLNLIGAPPADPSAPPFGPGERGEIDPAARWFNRITIE